MCLIKKKKIIFLYMKTRIRSNSNSLPPKIIQPTLKINKIIQIPIFRRPSFENSNTSRNSLKNGKDSLNSKSANYTIKNLNNLNIQNKKFSFEEDDINNLTQTCLIRILSNWGDENLISCSDILFLDDRHKSLPILSIQAEPIEINKTNLKNMFNGLMCKNNLNDCWISSWNHLNPIEITIITTNSGPISQIRFFNSSVQGKTAIKEIEVLINDILLWKGEISIDFGVVANLDKNKFSLIEKSKKIAPEIIYKRNLSLDNFGLIPQCCFSKFKIFFLNNYGHPIHYGLNYLSFFDNKGNIIKRSLITLSLNNIEIITDATNLIQDKKNFNDNDQFVFSKTNDNILSFIEIIFNEPILIGGIIINNYSNKSFSIDISIKDIKIIANEKFIYWIGRLKKFKLNSNNDLTNEIIYFSDLI